MTATPVYTRPNPIAGEEIKEQSEKEDTFFAQFAGKRVKIQYINENDWVKNKGEKTGWLVKGNQNYALIPRRNSSKGQHLTLGLWAGWYATIIVTGIEVLN